ncbi:MAG: glycosyltransferase [Pirellulaceae bacterium]|nr:glycosyltransferase [Pirellulaceae bacterium]
MRRVPPDRCGVSLFVPTLSEVGPAGAILRLAGGLARRSIGVELVVADAGGPVLDRFPPSPRVIDLAAQRLRDAVEPLTGYLRQVRPACLLSRAAAANVAASTARELSGIPVRLVLVEDSHLAGQLTSGRVPVDLLPTLAWFYSRADAVVATSRSVADDVHSHLDLPRERIHVIADAANELHSYLPILGLAEPQVQRRSA